MTNMKLEKAKSQHEKWLTKNGVNSEQLAKRRKPSKKKPYTDLKISKEYYGNLSNTVAPPVLLNTIWEKLRTGNETPETIQAIKDKANQCAPLYNKGGNQYSSSKDELKNAGRKTAI